MRKIITIDSFIDSIKKQFVACSWNSVEDIKDFDFSKESMKKAEMPLVNLCTNGMCYWFAKILSEAYPGGRIYLNKDEGHVVYRYNSFMYDITGPCTMKGTYIPIEYIPDFVLIDYKHTELQDLTQTETASEEYNKLQNDAIDIAIKFAKLNNDLFVVY